jgi:hypothetical protein
MLAGHGWLQVLWLQILALNGLSLTPGWNIGLEIVAIHPNSEGTDLDQQHGPALWKTPLVGAATQISLKGLSREVGRVAA